MFGKNPIRSIINAPNLLAVEGHFYTIQGEGPYSGLPALFIRLSGCNLACHFCDTQFEEQAEKAQPVLDFIATLDKTYTAKQRAFVVITGGEPMRQNFVILADWLLSNGTELIQVETAGTLWQPDLEPAIKDGGIVLVCSPKTPKVHPLVAKHCHHWKYVVTAGEISLHDGLPNRGTQATTKDAEMTVARPPSRSALTTDSDTIYVSPCDAYDAEQNKRNLAAVVSSSLIFGHRVSLQIHKLLGVE
jgi:7-carboxy-7-deazaguanine synthase